MKRSVLITGGFGYLGGRIAQQLAREGGWQVRLGSRRLQSRDGQRSPAWLPEAEIVALDVLRPETFPAALSGVEAVVHLAALNAEESIAAPEQASRVTTEGTTRLLEAARQAGVKRFIYFSTAHVYGSPLVGHITEMTSAQPAHPYATTHYAAERSVLKAHADKDLVGIVLRLSNGFGAPAHPGANCWMLLVNDLCMRAAQEKRLVLRSSGLQPRDFVTLHDVGRVAGHFLGLRRSDCGDGLFNVGGECTMTVLAMAQRIAKCCREVLGYDPELLRPEPLGEEQSSGLQYDISRLKTTGFRLNGNMDEEISQTLRMCLSMKEGKA